MRHSKTVQELPFSANQNADPLAKDSIYVSYCIFYEDTASSLTQSSDAVNFGA